MYNAAVDMMDSGNHLLNPKFAEVKPVCAKAAGGHRCKKENLYIRIWPLTCRSWSKTEIDELVVKTSQVCTSIAAKFADYTLKFSFSVMVGPPTKSTRKLTS